MNELKIIISFMLCAFVLMSVTLYTAATIEKKIPGNSQPSARAIVRMYY